MQVDLYGGRVQLSHTHTPRSSLGSSWHFTKMADIFAISLISLILINLIHNSPGKSRWKTKLEGHSCNEACSLMGSTSLASPFKDGCRHDTQRADTPPAPNHANWEIDTYANYISVVTWMHCYSQETNDNMLERFSHTEIVGWELKVGFCAKWMYII